MRTIAYAQDKCINSQLLVTHLVLLFEHRKLDINRLLKGTKIFRQDLHSSDYQVSPLQLLDLIDNALTLWPGDDLAFLLGQQWLPAQSGPLTNAILCSSGLTEALHLWQQYHWLAEPWLQGWHWHTKHHHHLLLQLDLGAQRQQQFFIELTLSSLVSSYKKLTHMQWQGHFSLPFSQPQQLAQYYKYLGEDLLFEQPICAVSFNTQHNQHAFELASKQGLAQAKWQLTEQNKASAFAVGLPGAIRLLLTQSTTGNDTLPKIAAHFNLSPATLKRRLKDYGISFKQLQDQANTQKAIYLLAVSGQNNLTVAKQLNFADSNNFRRSFKRWTGQLPSQFKHWLNHAQQS